MAKTTVNTETGEIKFTPVVKKILNFPLLSQKKVDQPIYITILTAIKNEERVNEKGEKEKYASVIVMDLESESLAVVLLSTVQVSLLAENYGDDAYIGLSFEIINKGKREGKKYNDVSLTEIETPDFVNVTALQAKLPK